MASMLTLVFVSLGFANANASANRMKDVADNLTVVGPEISGSQCKKVGSRRTFKAIIYECRKAGVNLKWVKSRSQTLVSPPKATSNTFEGTSGGKNGVANVESSKVVVERPPTRMRQAYEISIELTCGRVMSLAGPQRYPEMRLVEFALGSTWEPVNSPILQGPPILRNGGNTAIYEFKAFAPNTLNLNFSLLVQIKDFKEPTCNDGIDEFRTVSRTGSFSITQTQSVGEGDGCDPSKRTSPIVLQNGDRLKCWRDLNFSQDGRESVGGVYMREKMNYPELKMPSGGSSLHACKLRDGQSDRNGKSNIGFPRKTGTALPLLPNEGTANVQMIAVDFPESPGTQDLLEMAEADISATNKWLEFYTNKKLSFSWQFHKSWLRMPKSWTDYGYVKGSGAKADEIGRAIVDVSDQYIDFSESDIVFVLFPRNLSRGGDYEIIGFSNRAIKSNEGLVKNFWGFSDPKSYGFSFSNMGYFIHEYSHLMGIPGHAPRGPDLMNGGGSFIKVWDSFLAGWLDEGELYCMPTSQKSLKTSLIPLQRLQHGLRGIIVPLSSTNALVVEAWRDEGEWETLLYGRQGVAVYWVDTTKNLVRYEGGSRIIGSDSGDDGAYVYDTDLGETYSQFLSPFTENYRMPTTLRHLLHRGESISYKGLTVKVLSLGDFPEVEVTRP